MNNPIIIKGNQYHPTSKNVKYNRVCDTCGKKYIGWGKFYCSKKCRQQPKGKNSSSWKGDNITAGTGRWRAEKLFPLKPCEICGSTKSERHHIDSNPCNNSPKNIKFVCRSCHKFIHYRLAKS